MVSHERIALSARNISDKELVSLLQAHVRGDVEADARRRAEYSTDASLYRIVPRVVVCPRDDKDVEETLKIAREYDVPFTSRGAGTSVAGNSIGPGIVLDFSRYMNKILEIDPEKRIARVQPGLVMAKLQKEAGKYGLRFGPDPSTQTRATFGGMIGNNACGPHAVAYGRTVDNVEEVTAFLADGRRIIAQTDNAHIIEGLIPLVDSHLAAVRMHMGTFKRQVSGYSLEHLLPENGRNLARFLVGSEGTLSVTTQAVLRLVPVPKAPTLLVLGYEDMPSAADDVPSLLDFEPLAVEGLDAELVNMVRRHKGSVPELPEGAGWLFIEVGAREGETEEDVMRRAQQMADAAHTDAYRICPAGDDATQLWRIRADGAGLAGRTKDDVQAWPSWEDSAVPPEKLGSYLRELRSLMDKHHLDGFMYGHFGDGCVHLRIDFPLDTHETVPVFRTFMEEASDLVASFGGTLSGEHGDGRCRSEMLPRMYPPEIIKLFEKVKHLFDPHNILNPGILVHPDTIDDNLRRPFAKATDYAGGFHFHEDNGDMTASVHRCTGVGNCRADRFDQGFFMCPSYDATKNEKDVTRGRVRVLEELTRGELFSSWDCPEVLESLDLCVSCKACSRDCPTGIDMARYKSEVLYRAYKGKMRPRAHYTVGHLPALGRILARIPGGASLVNAFMRISVFKNVFFRAAGLDTARKAPHFPACPLAKEKVYKKALSVDDFVSLQGNLSDKRYVVLWADSFSHTLDSAPALAAIELLHKAGYTVLVPPSDMCCGLTWISTGQLDTAKKKLQNLMKTLAPFAASGIPIVGVEPSCISVLRGDLEDLFPDDKRTPLISSMTFTLAELLSAPLPMGPGDALQLPDLTGRTIVAQPHCHHYSVMGWNADEKLIRATGANLVKISGCCGLAGNHGMEAGHFEFSKKIASQHLLPALEKAPDEAIYLADGFSCRTQAEQLAGKNGVHLAELLRDGANVSQ